MSWFSRRKEKKKRAAGAAAGVPSLVELEQRPLADLHGYAAKLGVKGYRLLRRDALVETLGEYAAQTNGSAPAAPAKQPEQATAKASPPKRERKQRPPRERAPKPKSKPKPEPAPEPESKPEPEPDPEPEEPEVTYEVTGIVDIARRGHGFLRIDGLARSDGDPYVSRSQIRRLELRSGDQVGAQVRAARRSERYPSVVRVETVEGGPAEAERAPLLDDVPAARASVAIEMSKGADDIAGRMIELVAPIGLGQRGLISSPPGAGATTMLREIAESLSGQPDVEVFVVLVDARPEEIGDWRRSDSVTVHASKVGDPPGAQIGMAELAVERAKRTAERGRQAIVLLDSATRLARARASGRGGRGGEDDASPEDRAIHAVKRLFASSRAGESGGSLTILATARSNSDSDLEADLLRELADAANMEVVLDAGLAGAGLYPAIDLSGSQARSEEGLVPEDNRHRLQALRSVIGSLEPRDAWEFIEAKLRETRSNDELLKD